MPINRILCLSITEKPISVRTIILGLKKKKKIVWISVFQTKSGFSKCDVREINTFYLLILFPGVYKVPYPQVLKICLRRISSFEERKGISMLWGRKRVK